MAREVWPVAGSTDYVAETAAVIDDLQDDRCLISGMRQVLTAGRYYDSMATVGGVEGTTALIADLIFFVPFWVGPDGFAADRIALSVTSGAAGAARLGVYAAHATTHLPDALVDDAGTVDTTSTGLVTVTVAETYTADAPYNLLFLAVTSNAGATVRAIQPLGPSLFGSNGTQNNLGFWKSQSYGALPDPAGSVNYLNASSVPMIMLRKS